MTNYFKSVFCFGVWIALVFPMFGYAQENSETSEFENSTPILDTKILFAIGAREAEQQIRGSFGWPTFQEGFVEGVYFRFDPDGYARFATSPRLDENVFEVQCAPGTTACVARKPGIEIGLTNEGKVQLGFAGLTANDSFFVTDQKSELPLPPTVLDPLDARLETLLSSSAELVVKRELEVIQQVPLNGFNAVITYLRWVAQQQSSRVFPRGWPVPAQIENPQVGAQSSASIWPNLSGTTQTVQTTFEQANAKQNGNLQSNVIGQNSGLQQVATGSSGLEQMQLQMAALQAEIARLQNSGNVNATVQAPQGQTLPKQVQSQQNLQGFSAQTIGANIQNEEFGISFAQQAQGRSLQEPTGLQALGISDPATGAAQIPNANQGAFLPNGTIPEGYGVNQESNAQFETQVATLKQQNTLLIQEVAFVRNRLNQLEVGMLNLQRQTMAELNALKQMNWQGQNTVGQHDAMPNEKQARAQDALELGQGRQPMTMAPSESDEKADQLEVLEKLLIERLARRDGGQALKPTKLRQPADAPTTSSNETMDQVPVQRSIVEELLSKISEEKLGEEAIELEQQPSQVTVKPEPIDQEATVTNTEAPKEDDGFVTLSDYINKVLKAEGLEGGLSNAN